MSVQVKPEQWITGEEYSEERRRLREAGRRSDSPEFAALRRRVAERNEHIWHAFGTALMRSHPGKWAAITAAGEYALAESELAALRLGRERFGPGNSLIVRLDESRGAARTGVRSL